ncbi:MAG TPA: hypothetical protein VMV08_04740 [Gaiellaceae bacterium]|nr:hypothetical protein [Gaiellaceae bacterium]
MKTFVILEDYDGLRMPIAAEYSVRPFADSEHPLDADQISAILDALLDDPRAIGPA